MSTATRATGSTAAGSGIPLAGASVLGTLAVAAVLGVPAALTALARAVTAPPGTGRARTASSGSRASSSDEELAWGTHMSYQMPGVASPREGDCGGECARFRHQGFPATPERPWRRRLEAGGRRDSPPEKILARPVA